jgi:hypothetical protein
LHDHRLDGAAPKDRFPCLFKHVIRRSCRLQQLDCSSLCQARQLSALGAYSVIHLWAFLPVAPFSVGQDPVVWKWTVDIKYSTSSAYQIQFYISNLIDLHIKPHRSDFGHSEAAWVAIEGHCLTSYKPAQGGILQQPRLLAPSLPT